MAKAQFQSSEFMKIRFTPFLNRNDGSEITGDVCRLYVLYPDGVTLVDDVTNPTIIPTPVYQAGIGYWTANLDPAIVYAAGGPGTYLIKATSDNVNAMVQRKQLEWGDYANDITTGKTAAVAAQAAAESADSKATDIKTITDALPTFPLDPAAESTVTTLSGDVAAVKLDTEAIKERTDNLPDDPATQTTLTLLEQVATGKWVIDPTAKQLILYRWDSMWIEFQRFDLFDKYGDPSAAQIYSRVPVVTP